MATLADINKTLNRVDDNTETTSKGTDMRRKKTNVLKIEPCCF